MTELNLEQIEYVSGGIGELQVFSSQNDLYGVFWIHSIITAH